MQGKIRQAYEKVHAQRFVMQVLIIALAVAADQITKFLIVPMLQKLPPDTSISIVGNLLRLTFVPNPGASFGILQGKQTFFLIATAITLVVLGGYMVIARKKQPLYLRITLSLIVAGAIGNFIDRILYGYVRDFVDIRGLYFPWIFNIADMCLVVGSIMLAVYLLFIYKEKDGKTLFARREKKKDEQPGDDEKTADEAEEAEPQPDEAGGENGAEKKPEKTGGGE